MKKYSGSGLKRPKGEVVNIDSAIGSTRPFRLKKAFRLIYPPQTRPRVLDIDYDVVDLSTMGIKFACNQRSYQCPESLAINNSVNLKIQFDDGDIVEVEVKILRCFEDVELGRTCFAGSIIRGMSQRRMDKEYAYIQRCFSGFHEH